MSLRGTKQIPRMHDRCACEEIAALRLQLRIFDINTQWLKSMSL